jgi:hypothetical protein
MKKQYQFVEQLVQKLTEYNSIDQEISKLEERKKVIREQIDNWLILHDCDLFEINDSQGQLWKLNKYITIRNKVTDYDILKLVLPKEHKNLVSTSESETFAIKRINKHSKEWLIKNN